MRNYLSNLEINELSEGIIEDYLKNFPEKKNPLRIDIDGFAEQYLELKIKYASFAEPDGDKIGFLSDGMTPIYIFYDGRKRKVIYEKK